MVWINVITISLQGVPGPMVSNTIDCGIALLLGGNVDVQQKMLDHLQEKKDVGFFIAMSGFMQQCRYCFLVGCCGKLGGIVGIGDNLMSR